jgi:EAL and modified HD-GYP domain-containing signal transduction protein
VSEDAKEGGPQVSAGGAQAVIRRQAVFDARDRLAGYELLLGRGIAPGSGSDAAAVITAAFGDLGLRRVVGDHRAYVTAPFEVLSAAGALRLPAGQLVLLVAEQPVDERLLGLARDLVQQGFGVGLGGWALAPGAEPLVRLATAVKVDFDFGTRHLTQLVAQRDALHAQGATLIAAHVQTRGEHEEARRLGFDAFQGAYLGQPAAVTARLTPTQRMDALAAVLTATGPGAFEDLERLIVQDAGLAHRFLHLAGSAFYASRARVRSVHDALARLGADAVRRWVLMLVLAGLADSSSETDRHLLGVGLHRGRICELLAGQDPEASADRAFSAGLLSVLPGLVDQPMPELVAELPIDETLARALTHHEGREGRMLAAAIAYEDGEREGPDGDPSLLAAISRLYTDALLWADDTRGQLT